MMEIGSYLERISAPSTAAVDVALEAEGLRVEVGQTGQRRAVVRSISLSLRRGEITALVGESGSGKTMTALALMRLLPPGALGTATKLRIGTLDLAQLSEGEMARIRGRNISMIFQDPLAALNPVRTIGFQITEPLRAHFHLDRRAATARAADLLGQVGIEDPLYNLHRYAHELSGGMRQRVLIAAALACDPQILIADEPTTALDVTVQAQVLKLIRDQAERRGLAVLLVTHDLAVASMISDRIQVMYSGAIVERGTSRELLRAPNHPYTRGLLNSVPSPLHTSVPMISIPGTPDGAWRLDHGCRFAPRCALAVPQCSEDEPPLDLIQPTHESRCWVEAHPRALAR
jgi:peptide/nickel transport system ATP-binding protein